MNNANVLQMSDKYEVFFNVFHSEYSVYSRFVANVRTNEQNNKVNFVYFATVAVNLYRHSNIRMHS